MQHPSLNTTSLKKQEIPTDTTILLGTCVSCIQKYSKKVTSYLLATYVMKSSLWPTNLKTICKQVLMAKAMCASNAILVLETQVITLSIFKIIMVHYLLNSLTKKLLFVISALEFLLLKVRMYRDMNASLVQIARVPYPSSNEQRQKFQVWFRATSCRIFHSTLAGVAASLMG